MTETYDQIKQQRDEARAQGEIYRQEIYRWKAAKANTAKERDEARAACAEMRQGLELLDSYMVSAPSSDQCKAAYDALEDWWMVSRNTWRPNDCGKDLLAELEALRGVAQWAQATLTALNVGDVMHGSPLHLKLREIMIAHRQALNPQTK